MKSELTPLISSLKPEIKFPCLMISKHSDQTLIVLFHEKNRGTVIYSTSDTWKPGYYKHDWVFTLFELLPSDQSVILKND